MTGFQLHVPIPVSLFKEERGDDSTFLNLHFQIQEINISSTCLMTKRYPPVVIFKKN